ncbi:Uncharacterised protein r2_g2786 [Pycnogonum litorale]
MGSKDREASLSFTLYINDLPGVCESSSVLLYADDAKNFKSITSDEDRHLLQSDLNHLSEWLKKWRLSLNIKKCACITFSRKKDPGSFNYELDNQPVNRVTKIKDLGVIMTCDVKWSSHLQMSVNKAFKLCGFVKRQTYNFSSITAIRKLYVSLVRPILEYASVIWNSDSKTNDGRLERVQHSQDGPLLLH